MGMGDEGPSTAAPEVTAWFQDVLDNAPSAIYAKDRDQRYLFVNRVYERIAGIDRTVAIGRTDDEIYGASSVDALAAANEEVLETGSVVDIEGSLEMAD